MKKNRAQKIMVVQEREWSEKERMEKKQWLKGFFAVDLQENVIKMEKSCNVSEHGGKPLFRETLHMANKGVGKYRVDNAATVQLLYHFYPILH